MWNDFVRWLAHAPVAEVLSWPVGIAAVVILLYLVLSKET